MPAILKEEKEQRINITLEYSVICRLKQLSKEKAIPSMSKFCQEAITEKLMEFDRNQKAKLMEIAAQDPDYISRCQETSQAFAFIDQQRGNEEW